MSRRLRPAAFWTSKTLAESLVGVSVTLEPVSEIDELPIPWAAVNLASFPEVPPAVVTPPPTPAQLPAVEQIEYDPAAAVRSKLYVTEPLGLPPKASVVVNPPPVAVTELEALP
jgi:hypothetical protein